MKTEVTDVLEVWRKYYTEKFTGKDNIVNIKQETEISIEQLEGITQKEIEEAVHRIKTGKTCRDDDVDPEMVKYLGEEGRKWL